MKKIETVCTWTCLYIFHLSSRAEIHSTFSHLSLRAVSRWTRRLEVGFVLRLDAEVVVEEVTIRRCTTWREGEEGRVAVERRGEWRGLAHVGGRRRRRRGEGEREGELARISKRIVVRFVPARPCICAKTTSIQYHIYLLKQK